MKLEQKSEVIILYFPKVKVAVAATIIMQNVRRQKERRAEDRVMRKPRGGGEEEKWTLWRNMAEQGGRQRSMETTRGGKH